MADTSFQRTALFSLAAAAVIILILIILTIFGDVLFQYVVAQFGLAVSADKQLISVDGEKPGMMAQTTYDLALNVFLITKIFLWMALVVLVVRFIANLILRTAIRGSEQAEMGSLLRTVLSIIIYIVAFFIIFQTQYPNVQLAPLFTGSTIIGIVVGLALQDTLGNLFAGIALQADQPFLVGDVISISNRGTGVVEAVSWRGVKIRTFQNKLLVISNAVLGRETIEVAPKGNLNARIVFFNTVFSNSPSKTIQLVREAVRQVENVSNKLRPIVRVRNLGDNGIDWELKYWLDDYTKYNDTDALIRQRIWYVFKRENIDFAFPTRTVHIEPKPESLSVEDVVNETAEHLSKVPVFTPLSEDEIGRLARGSVRRVFAPGETIVRKGQEGRSMFVIIRGSVKIQIPDHSGQKTINQLAQNDFFGEMSLLTGEPRSANVVAENEVEILEIRKAALKPIFEDNPSLMTSVCEMIEERKLLLFPAEEVEDAVAGTSRQSILQSIRRFFGIRNKG
ncbi:MAG: cyclic nucleotide-binding domain-containing protein [Pyrinomonadaceae bacterium]